MTKEEANIPIPDEVITSKIYFIRGKNVMLDQDLAELYDVETKRLNEQVKRNLNRYQNPVPPQVLELRMPDLLHVCRSLRFPGL